MSQAFTPRPYQKLAFEHLVETPRCALWAGMGMGKSVTTLNVLDALYATGLESRPTLVLAPKRVAQSTWPEEVRKWAHLSHIEISPIVGTEAERRRALDRDVSVYTMNYENLLWLLDQLGTTAWPFGTVVADESTRLKSFRIRQGGKRAQALGRVAHSKISRFIELTGTPSPNGLQDLWGQAWMLDAGVRLGRTYEAFKDRWFQVIPGGDGYTQLRPLAHAQAEIQERLKDLCLTLDPKDWFDIKEPIVTPVYVDLPMKARMLYEDMEKEMYMEIESVGVEAFNAASRTMKLLQLANGAVYVDERGNYKEVHDEKIDALKSIVEEAAGAPVLVAYHFKSDLARLQHAFPYGRPLDADPQTISDWNNGRIRVLFAHPASAGHGLNLQDGGNILAFFGHNWNLEEYQQIIERIGPVRQLQAGHNRPVWIYHIIARDTVDELVMARRESKRSVQDLVLESMKRNHKPR